MIRSLLLGLLVVASVAEAACGGQTEPSTGPAGAANPKAPSSEPSQPPSTLKSTAPGCTSSAPTPRAPCSNSGFGYFCEYGTSENPSCNTVAECVTRGAGCNGVDDCARSLRDRVWSVVPPDAAKCSAPPAPPPTTVPRPASCPATRPFLGTACRGDVICVYSCEWTPSVCIDGFWSEGNPNPCVLGHGGGASGGTSGPSAG